MKILLPRIALALLLVAGLAPSASAQLTMFVSAQQAQRHCPNDTVVWLNLRSGIYHMPGTRWYGATKNGAFVCEREADKAGDRQSRNGQ